MNELQKTQLITGLDFALLDVVEQWGDDVFSGTYCNQKHNDLTALITLDYDRKQYVLLEDGSLFLVSSKSIKDGFTWNGDDNYIPSFKTIFTYHNKVGSISIEDADYSEDENLENIACQLIEALRDL